MRFGRAELRGRPSREDEPSIVLYTGPVWRLNLPWPVVSIFCAVVSSLGSWLVIVGFCLLGWLGVVQVPMGLAIRLGTQGWLLAHGVAVSLPGLRLSIIPLGLSAIFFVITSGMASLVAKQVHAVDLSTHDRRKWVLKIGVLFGLVYSLIAAFVASSTEGAGQFLPGLAGGMSIGLIGALRGASKTIRWQLRTEIIRLRWPRWWDALPRATLAGTLMAIGSAAVVVMIALLRYHKRVVSLHHSLDPDFLGHFLLLIGQLAYLPNVILWTTAWLSGAGVSFGTETIISPIANQVGLVPAIPLLGMIPPAGIGPRSAWLWLLSIAFAGATSAVIMVVRQAREHERCELDVPRPDLTTLTGGLAGVCTGLVVCLFVALSNGDLGTARLVNIGARFPAMLIMTPTLMGLAGSATGFGFGLVRRLRARRNKLEE